MVPFPKTIKISIVKSHKCRIIEPLSVSIPNGFNPLENDLLPNGLVMDRLKLILHQLYLLKVMSLVSDNDIAGGGWVSLHSKILKLAGTKHYVKYISWLLSNNIIELKKNYNGTKKYSVKNRSQEFRFSSDVLKSINGTLFHVEKITDFKTVKAGNRLKKYFAERPIKNSRNELTSIHHQLIRMTESVKFRLELFEEMRYADDFLKSVSADKTKLLDEFQELLKAINQGNVKFATVDEFGERLHTPLTNLWSGLRKFMYFNDFPNDDLVALDFANSQPYFSSVCGSVKFVKEILPEFKSCIPVIQKANDSEDFKAFASLCSEGSIYDFWAAARGIVREKAKNELMAQVMFGKPKSTHAIIRNTRKIFGSHFPSVLKMFDQIKTMNDDTLPFVKALYLDEQKKFTGRKHFYKNLACMMQRAESRLVIGKIAPALIATGLVPFITVHDSFIVRNCHEESARKVIQAEFEKLNIQPPKVKATELIFNRE